LERGISIVSTPSHGGVRIAEQYARKNLSEAARKRAIRQGTYFFFEEDCDFFIPFWELPHLWPKAFPSMDAQTAKALLLRSLSDWNAQYLLEQKVTPDPEAFTRWSERQERDRLLQMKSPDLIVAASACCPGIVEVICADCKIHFVTHESYNVRTGLALLSKCVEVPMPAGILSLFAENHSGRLANETHIGT
jgi:hypothetical protein